tara:strand:+ start:1888 stop:2946 length:1059 start_codon:yes stop_codon:yes gene_type:complete
MAEGKLLDLVAKYGPAVAEFISASRSANQFGDAFTEQAISDQYDDLRENLPQYDVGPAFRKYLATAMENPVADAARRRLDETKATTIEALGQTPQGTQNLIKALRQIEGAESRIDAKEQADLNKALGVFAQQEQRADMLNTQAQQRIAASELAAQRQAELQRSLVDAGRRQATGQAIGKGLELLGDLEFGDGEGGGFRDFINNLQLQRYLKTMRKNNPDQVEGEFVGPTIPGDLQEQNQGGQFFGTLGAGMGGTGGGISNTGGVNYDGTLDLDGNPATGNSQNFGGMITPGSFSHESNPLDVIQDGVKIAELTGGEIVLNPDQSNQVAKESSFFRKLRRKFKKAQQKQEDES